VRLPPFQGLLDAHGAEVHRVLVALVGPDEADDCFQETVLSALRAYPRLRDAANLRAWLLTIARRKAIDAARAGARRPRPMADPPERPAPERPDRDPDLWADVRRLPPRMREAVTLRHVADLPYDAVAATMGCSPEAARRSVHEGLTRLRRWRSE